MSSAPSTWCRCANTPSRSASLLSGGQQQRVALARADRVLADRPAVRRAAQSNLDAKLRAEMRVELRDLQRRLDITSVYVTHDQEEALAISDRVIVMNMSAGSSRSARPEDIYNRPKTRFVADFVGSANLIAGRLKSPPDGAGPVLFESPGGVLLQARAAHPPRGDEDTVAVRTAHIDLAARAAATAQPTPRPAISASACSTATSSSTSSTGRPGS